MHFSYQYFCLFICVYLTLSPQGPFDFCWLHVCYRKFLLGVIKPPAQSCCAHHQGGYIFILDSEQTIKSKTKLCLPLLSSLEIGYVHVCSWNPEKMSEWSLRPKILYLLISSQAGESVWGYQLASGLKHISAAQGLSKLSGYRFLWQCSLRWCIHLKVWTGNYELLTWGITSFSLFS